MLTPLVKNRPEFLPEGTYWLSTNGVQVQRVNILTSEISTHLLPCTMEQFEGGRKKACQGALMQDAFPFLSPPDRDGAAL